MQKLELDQPEKPEVQILQPQSNLTLIRRPIIFKVWIKPMIILIIAIILLGFALVTAWWHVEIEMEGTLEAPRGGGFEEGGMAIIIDFKYNEVEAEVDYSGDIENTNDDSKDTMDYDEFANADNMETFFNIIGVVTIITIVVAIITIVFVIICGLGLLSFRNASSLCFLVLLLSLIAPILLALFIDDKCKDDAWPGPGGRYGEGEFELRPITFFHSEETEGEEGGAKGTLSLNAYPTIAWYLSIVVIILNVMALVLVVKLERAAGPSKYGSTKRLLRQNPPTEHPIGMKSTANETDYYEVEPLEDEPVPQDLHFYPLSKEKKWISGVPSLVLLIIAIMLLLISLSVPWYHFEFKDTSGYLAGDGWSWDFTFEGVDYKIDSRSGTTKWADTGDDETEGVFDTLWNLIIIAIIISIIALVFILLSIWRIGTVNLALILTLVSFIFILIIPVYFAIALPSAIDEDNEGEVFDIEYSGFYGGGNDDYDGIEATWNPVVGWYLSFMAMILSIMAFGIIVFKRKLFKPLMRFSQYPTMQPQQQEQLSQDMEIRTNKSNNKITTQKSKNITYLPNEVQYMIQKENERAVITKEDKELTSEFIPFSISCSKCETKIIITTPNRPLTIICPECGNKGILRADKKVSPNIGEAEEFECSECGADVTEHDKFCPNCGEVLEDDFLLK